jgi:phosphoribosylanthranilate isomerase
VSAAQAVELARPVRGQALRVAVMRHATQGLLDEVLTVFAPDLLQCDAAELAALRLPATLRLLPVVRDVEAPPSPLPARLLFEGARSGAGVLPDWRLAARLAARTQLVLAGGLDPGNVAAAIGAVQPFGVDVSSGVEERPGVKSPATIEEFVRAARAAAPAAHRITEEMR